MLFLTFNTFDFQNTTFKKKTYLKKPMKKKSNKLLILITSLSIMTSLFSIFILFTGTNTNSLQDITGASTKNLENMELHEGYSQQLDLNNDELADIRVTLNYADKGLATFKVEKLPSYCKNGKEQ